ncbi:MAG: hypothetical protein ABII71_01490 [Candidatus Micrarchaeota archaeon]
MWLEVCGGLLVLACLAVMAYLLFFSKPIKITRRVSGSVVHVVVKANRDISKIELSAGNDISFVRKNIKKGQEVEFTYPASEKPAKMAIELGEGKTKEYGL